MVKKRKAPTIKRADQAGMMDGADDYMVHYTLLEARADEWIRLNPALWRKFTAHCLNEVAHNRRISVRWLIEEVRKRDHVNRNGDPVKVNNNYSPIFARRLIAEHPELRGAIELRRCIHDVMMGE